MKKLYFNNIHIYIYIYIYVCVYTSIHLNMRLWKTAKNTSRTKPMVMLVSISLMSSVALVLAQIHIFVKTVMIIDFQRFAVFVDRNFGRYVQTLETNLLHPLFRQASLTQLQFLIYFWLHQPFQLLSVYLLQVLILKNTVPIV